MTKLRLSATPSTQVMNRGDCDDDNDGANTQPAVVVPAALLSTNEKLSVSTTTTSKDHDYNGKILSSSEKNEVTTTMTNTSATVGSQIAVATLIGCISASKFHENRQHLRQLLSSFATSASTTSNGSTEALSTNGTDANATARQEAPRTQSKLNNNIKEDNNNDDDILIENGVTMTPTMRAKDMTTSYTPASSTTSSSNVNSTNGIKQVQRPDEILDEGFVIVDEMIEPDCSSSSSSITNVRKRSNTASSSTSASSVPKYNGWTFPNPTSTLDDENNENGTSNSNNNNKDSSRKKRSSNSTTTTGGAPLQGGGPVLRAVGLAVRRRRAHRQQLAEARIAEAKAKEIMGITTSEHDNNSRTSQESMAPRHPTNNCIVAARQSITRGLKQWADSASAPAPAGKPFTTITLQQQAAYSSNGNGATTATAKARLSGSPPPIEKRSISITPPGDEVDAVRVSHKSSNITASRKTPPTGLTSSSSNKKFIPPRSPLRKSTSLPSQEVEEDVEQAKMKKHQPQKHCSGIKKINSMSKILALSPQHSSANKFHSLANKRRTSSSDATSNVGSSAISHNKTTRLTLKAALGSNSAGSGSDHSASNHGRRSRMKRSPFHRKRRTHSYDAYRYLKDPSLDHRSSTSTSSSAALSCPQPAAAAAFAAVSATSCRSVIPATTPILQSRSTKPAALRQRSISDDAVVMGTVVHVFPPSSLLPSSSSSSTSTTTTTTINTATPNPPISTSIMHPREATADIQVVKTPILSPCTSAADAACSDSTPSNEAFSSADATATAAAASADALLHLVSLTVDEPNTEEETKKRDSVVKCGQEKQNLVTKTNCVDDDDHSSLTSVPSARGEGIPKLIQPTSPSRTSTACSDLTYDTSRHSSSAVSDYISYCLPKRPCSSSSQEHERRLASNTCSDLPVPVPRPGTTSTIVMPAAPVTPTVNQPKPIVIKKEQAPSPSLHYDDDSEWVDGGVESRDDERSIVTSKSTRTQGTLTSCSTTTSTSNCSASTTTSIHDVLRSHKIVVLGKPQCGKTTVVNMLRERQTTTTNYSTSPTEFEGNHYTSDASVLSTGRTNNRKSNSKKPFKFYKHKSDSRIPMTRTKGDEQDNFNDNEEEPIWYNIYDCTSSSVLQQNEHDLTQQCVLSSSNGSSHGRSIFIVVWDMAHYINKYNIILSGNKRKNHYYDSSSGSDFSSSEDDYEEDDYYYNDHFNTSSSLPRIDGGCNNSAVIDHEHRIKMILHDRLRNDIDANVQPYIDQIVVPTTAAGSSTSSQFSTPVPLIVPVVSFADKLMMEDPQDVKERLRLFKERLNYHLKHHPYKYKLSFVDDDEEDDDKKQEALVPSFLRDHRNPSRAARVMVQRSIAFKDKIRELALQNLNYQDHGPIPLMLVNSILTLRQHRTIVTGSELAHYCISSAEDLGFMPFSSCMSSTAMAQLKMEDAINFLSSIGEILVLSPKGKKSIIVLRPQYVSSLLSSLMKKCTNSPKLDESFGMYRNDIKTKNFALMSGDTIAHRICGSSRRGGMTTTSIATQTTMDKEHEIQLLFPFFIEAGYIQPVTLHYQESQQYNYNSSIPVPSTMDAYSGSHSLTVARQQQQQQQQQRSTRAMLYLMSSNLERLNLQNCSHVAGWTYQCMDSWKVTLGTSWYFPRGLPSSGGSFVPRIFASVLEALEERVLSLEDQQQLSASASTSVSTCCCGNGSSSSRSSSYHSASSSTTRTKRRRMLQQQTTKKVVKVVIREVFCWENAFLIKLLCTRRKPSLASSQGGGDVQIMTIFGHIGEPCDVNSIPTVCTTSKGTTMPTTTTGRQQQHLNQHYNHDDNNNLHHQTRKQQAQQPKRFVVCVRGVEGPEHDKSTHLWEGGYHHVVKAIDKVIESYSSSSATSSASSCNNNNVSPTPHHYQKESLCPTCLLQEDASNSNHQSMTATSSTKGSNCCFLNWDNVLETCRQYPHIDDEGIVYCSRGHGSSAHVLCGKEVEKQERDDDYYYQQEHRHSSSFSTSGTTTASTLTSSTNTTTFTLLDPTTSCANNNTSTIQQYPQNSIHQASLFRSAPSICNDHSATSIQQQQLLQSFHQQLCPAVVLVGLVCQERDQIVRVGSGFIVDAKRGLIVTAMHVLCDIQGPLGKFYGLRKARIVIGVIPQQQQQQQQPQEEEFSSFAYSHEELYKETTAVFRYYAEVAVMNPRGNVDACVLRIKSRMENDVTNGMGESIGRQHEHLILRRKMKKECLPQLEVASLFYMGEHVRMVGYNQEGDGLLMPGTHLNQTLCYAKGEICGIFRAPQQQSLSKETTATIGRRLVQVPTKPKPFCPQTEIKVEGITFVGHSGGPCVNVRGHVVGILSRGMESRSFIVPANDFMPLVKQAKKQGRPTIGGGGATTTHSNSSSRFLFASS